MSDAQLLEGDTAEALLTSLNNMIKNAQEKTMSGIASANESQEYEKSVELSGS